MVGVTSGRSAAIIAASEVGDRSSMVRAGDSNAERPKPFAHITDRCR